MWKDFFQAQTSNDKNLVFYMYSDPDDHEKKFYVKKIEVSDEDFNLDEYQIDAVVQSMLESFPVRECVDSYEKSISKLNIQRSSGRGIANREWKNVIFYAGYHCIDSPILICRKGDKYGVFKNPHFESYGLVIKMPM